MEKLDIKQQIAIQVLCAMVSKAHLDINEQYHERQVKKAIMYADELIKQLDIAQ